MSTEVKLFENNEVRFISEDDTFWVVGKDVLKALDYPESSIRQLNNVFQSIPEEWKDHKPIMTPGGTQQMICLSEQGLYFFLGRSDKPKAIPYQKWIAGEVVPSIRKTGGYSLSPNLTRDQNDIILAAKHVFEIGLHDQNQIMLAVDKVFKKVYGVSALEIGKIELQATQQRQLLTPTEIGVELEKIGGGKFSGKRVNKILETIGFQKKVADYWEVTDSGKSYAVYLDTNKRHSDGTPIRQLKWTSDVIFFIKNLLGLGE